MLRNWTAALVAAILVFGIGVQVNAVTGDPDGLEASVSPEMMEGSIGALTADISPEEPWADSGVSPFGHYYRNLDEYVSPSSGRLTVHQTDLPTEGDKLNVSIARVYQSPSVLTTKEVPTGGGLSWASFGPGWRLDVPHVDSKYIHWWNGQQIPHTLRYETDFSTCGIHKVGQHFTLRKYMNLIDPGGDNLSYWVMDHWEVDAADGVKGIFDATGRPVRIWNPNGFTLSFTYAQVDGSSRLVRINDSVGRTANVQYESGRIYNITVTGPELTQARAVSYEYTDGKLTAVKDALAATQPVGHTTRFTYDPVNTYLLTKITYPSGGASTYSYDYVSRDFIVDEQWTYFYRYRVRSHTREVKAGTPSQGDYWRQYSYVMGTSSVNWARVLKCTVETHEKPQDPTLKLKEVWDIEDSEYSVVTTCTTTDPATGKVLRRLEYSYNSNKEPTQRRETRYGQMASATATLVTSWTYDPWGNVTEERNPLGFSKYTAYANGWPGGTSGKWDSSDFYTNVVGSDIHNRPVGVLYYQDTNKTVRVETYYQYDASGRGNLTEVKQRLDSPAGPTWVKTSYQYSTANGLTYGPTRVTRGAHLGLAEQAITDIAYDQYLAFPWKKTATVDSVVTDVSSLTRIANYPIVTTETYWANIGKKTSETDANGNTKTYQYDQLGRPTLMLYPQRAGETGRLAAGLEYPVEADGSTTALVYHGIWDGQKIGTRSLIKHHIFDGLGRESEVRTYLSESDHLAKRPESVRKITYNWLGAIAMEEITRCATPLLPREQTYVTYREYDALGRVTRVTNSDGTYVTTVYDDAHDWTGDGVADGSLTTVTDERGNVKKYYHDWLDRLTMVREYAGGPGAPLAGMIQTTYVYDAVGNLKQVTDGRGNWVKYTYDTLNRVVRVDYSIGNPVIRTYDGLGRLQAKRDQMGTEMTYTYDRLDRLRSIKQTPYGSAETLLASFEYDPAGNQVLAANGSTVTKRFPDEFNRIRQEETTINGKTFTTHYRFDHLGRLGELELPNRRSIGYRYDGAGRVSGILRGGSDDSPILASYQYHPVGLPSEVAFGNGVRATNALDTTRPRIDRISVIGPGGHNLFDQVFLFEPDGNIRSINSDIFEYDGLGRLVGSTVH